MLSWPTALCYDKHNDYCTEKEEPEMKSLSIYAITRKQNTEQLQKLGRQLSGRAYFLKVYDWEMNSMKAFVDRLGQHMEEMYALRFFDSFTIPRPGNDFIGNCGIVKYAYKNGKFRAEEIIKAAAEI